VAFLFAEKIPMVVILSPPAGGQAAILREDFSESFGLL
jgi:hypothetical protein